MPPAARPARATRRPRPSRPARRPSPQQRSATQARAWSCGSWGSPPANSTSGASSPKPIPIRAVKASRAASRPERTRPFTGSSGAGNRYVNSLAPFASLPVRTTGSSSAQVPAEGHGTVDVVLAHPAAVKREGFPHVALRDAFRLVDLVEKFAALLLVAHHSVAQDLEQPRRHGWQAASNLVDQPSCLRRITHAVEHQGHRSRSWYMPASPPACI